MAFLCTLEFTLPHLSGHSGCYKRTIPLLLPCAKRSRAPSLTIHYPHWRQLKSFLCGSLTDDLSPSRPLLLLQNGHPFSLIIVTNCLRASVKISGNLSSHKFCIEQQYKLWPGSPAMPITYTKGPPSDKTMA